MSLRDRMDNMTTWGTLGGHCFRFKESCEFIKNPVGGGNAPICCLPTNQIKPKKEGDVMEWQGNSRVRCSYRHRHWQQQQQRPVLLGLKCRIPASCRPPWLPESRIHRHTLCPMYLQCSPLIARRPTLWKVTTVKVLVTEALIFKHLLSGAKSVYFNSP